MSNVYQIFGSKGIMQRIALDLPMGQRVMQSHKHENGVICESSEYGYTVIFPDGSESTGQVLDCLSPFTRIVLRDGIAGPDEVNRLIQLRNAKRVTDRWDQEETAKQKASQIEKVTAELRAKYPWAQSANPSKNIKTELSKAFPGIKFSVRQRHHSSIDISWTDGPSTKQVEEVTGKYSSGSFDGMVDCFEYDHSAFGEAVSAVLGRAQYISPSRQTSDALIQKAIDRVAKEYNRIPPEVTVEAYKKGDLSSLTPFENGTGNDYYWSYQSLINRELAKIGMMPKQDAQ